jgi:hypothetical protein
MRYQHVLCVPVASAEPCTRYYFRCCFASHTPWGQIQTCCAVKFNLVVLSCAASCHVVCAGQNVGGCNDGPGVMTLQKEGKLLPMLKQAGALA